MKQQQDPNDRIPRTRRIRPMTASAALGMALGTSIGALLGNPGIGAGLGLSSGLAVGALAQTLRGRRRSGDLTQRSQHDGPRQTE